MDSKILINKSKAFISSFEKGDIEYILSFCDNDIVVQDVGIALAYNKPQVTLCGKEEYRKFLQLASPKRGKTPTPEVLNILVNKNAVCIEFVKHNMHWCEVLEFRRGKIIANRGYFSGLPPKQVLQRLERIA